MTGDSVVPLIANFYAFGAKDFDVDRALHFMLDASVTLGVTPHVVSSASGSTRTPRAGARPRRHPGGNSSRTGVVSRPYGKRTQTAALQAI